MSKLQLELANLANPAPTSIDPEDDDDGNCLLFYVLLLTYLLVILDMSNMFIFESKIKVHIIAQSM